VTHTYDLHELSDRSDIPLRALRHIVDRKAIDGMVWTVGPRKARIFDKFNAFVLLLAAALVKEGFTLESAAELVNKFQGCKKSRRRESLYQRYITRGDGRMVVRCTEDGPVHIEICLIDINKQLVKASIEA
jgi:hypothetical protein